MQQTLQTGGVVRPLHFIIFLCPPVAAEILVVSISGRPLKDLRVRDASHNDTLAPTTPYLPNLQRNGRSFKDPLI